MRLLPFWAERPAVWFDQAKSQFSLVGISNEGTKFFYVTSQLDHRYATEVEAIICSPPQRDSYTTLRTEVINRLSPYSPVLTLEGCDRKASSFQKHLRSLVSDVPETFLCSTWSSRLSLNI
jgi:hypothetical protein